MTVLVPFFLKALSELGTVFHFTTFCCLNFLAHIETIVLRCSDTCDSFWSMVFIDTNYTFVSVGHHILQFLYVISTENTFLITIVLNLTFAFFFLLKG